MNAETMTVHQIAELCGVEDRTVRNWVHTEAEKDSAMAEKMSASTSTHPASFTLPETLTIIRAGGKGTLADLLAENARKGTLLEAPYTPDVSSMRALMLEMIPAMTAAMVAALRQVQPAAPSMLRQAHLALPAASPRGDWYTAKGYGNLIGTKVNGTVAVQLGREAARLSRERNVEIRKAADEQWGQVNCYHVSVLKDIFTV